MNSELGNGFWKMFVDSTSPRLLIKITEKQKVSGFSCFVSMKMVLLVTTGKNKSEELQVQVSQQNHSVFTPKLQVSVSKV